MDCCGSVGYVGGLMGFGMGYGVGVILKGFVVFGECCWWSGWSSW